MKAGASIGLSIGLSAAVATAVLAALIALVRGLTGQVDFAEVLITFVVHLFYGVIIGGLAGIVFGGLAGTFFGATGLERVAKWLTPAAMLAGAVFVVNDGHFGIDSLLSQSLPVLLLVALTVPIGWSAGKQFEHRTRGRSRARGRALSSPLPPARQRSARQPVGS
jgi:hypothetical protein